MNWTVYRAGSVVVRWGKVPTLRLAPRDAVKLAAALLVAAEVSEPEADIDVSDLEGAAQ